MANAVFKPILYLKAHCPFCTKLLIFLLEARILDTFDVRTIVPGTDEEARVKAELASHFDAVSFPAAQLSPGKYMKDSDALIAHFATQNNADPSQMFVLNWYVDGPFSALGTLWQENVELKKRIS